jgi:hypothetical protein
MKNYKIAFLKLAIGLIFISSIVASILWIPTLPKTFYAVLLTLVPLFSVLLSSRNLLVLIERDEAFSDGSVVCLKNISFGALSISLFYFLASIFLIAFDYRQSFIVISISFFFTSFSIYLFSAVLSELMENALKIKSENDLTI